MLLREAMEIVHAHQNSAPVQTVPLARSLGLEVYRTVELPNDISGMIIKDSEQGGPSGYAIFVNANNHTYRRRFTIAHEIGHFLLHRHLIGDGIMEDALLRAEGLSNRVEAQANKLAADILMPWHLIKECQDAGEVSIEDLASRFEVSRDAMSIRLLGLSYSRARDLQRESVADVQSPLLEFDAT